VICTSEDMKGLMRLTRSERTSQRMYDKALEIVHTPTSPVDGFRRFARECRAVAPHSVWETVGNLDLKKDVAHIERWFTTLLRQEPPPRDINGLWFGISDPFVDREGDAIGYELYLCGSNEFDATDLDDRWASFPGYEPAGAFAGSDVFHVLGQIDVEPRRFRLRGNSPAFPFVASFLPLLYACLLANWLVGRRPKLVLGRAVSRGIACGHDEGDAIRLGIVDSSGYRRAPLEETHDRLRKQNEELDRLDDEANTRRGTR